MIKLSVVLATRNEEANIERCLLSVKSIADEIVVVDEYSTDDTCNIAERLGAKVFFEKHHDIFHITKQKAMEKAQGDWILQLDADEVVTPALAQEIVAVINMTDEQIKNRINPNSRNVANFSRHMQLIEERDGKIGDGGNIVAFFIPRLNVFLGHPMKFGGVYPDGVIRLVKNGKTRFPQKSVHEQIEVDGGVSWLFNNLDHYDSPTLSRYFSRFNRYTDLHAKELKVSAVPKNLFYFLKYTFIKPGYTFFKIYIRHKGFLDGPQGFLWAFFSALHFPIAYFKYFTDR